VTARFYPATKFLDKFLSRKTVPGTILALFFPFDFFEEIQPLTTRTPRTAQRYQGSLLSSRLFSLFSPEPKVRGYF
jgi:hypothetical protein